MRHDEHEVIVRVSPPQGRQYRFIECLTCGWIGERRYGSYPIGQIETIIDRMEHYDKEEGD